MFRRKLTALDYHNPAGFNCRDETEFRNFIVWLEDQKIRHYKIEDRGNLRNIHSDDWPKSFEKAGVMALANLLQIQRHDDYLVMLKAIRILVQERLTQDAIAKASQSKEGLPVALEKHILGFDTGDAVLNEAAQILRLLHIEELRELQTKINEAIVAVQAIIADPKTDHRLGKVGR
ncbi:hypothetical protein AAES_134249 [Amazona aestiva]|uniref:RNA transcription, translation and transport factor protein n=1 Tax=Amazona aestiva TaxID=12930 RepID=A0A0Q3M1L8_AMAAE|nr:hypothetical protein AAES_134249 [Amazona aestiva]